MKILGLELSSAQRSVAILVLGGQGASRVLSALTETGVTGRAPLVLVAKALSDAALGAEEINGVVVGLGPGSYTGIRSALALALGWELARNVKVAGISSVAALALQAQSLGHRGLVRFAVDAQKNEVYLADYEISEKERRVVLPLRLAPKSEAAAAAVLIGPEANRWHANGQVLFPTAGALLTVGAMAGFGWQSAEQIQPLYLRETSFVKAPPPRIL